MIGETLCGLGSETGQALKLDDQLGKRLSEEH
jgi:hypothetical protein